MTRMDNDLHYARLISSQRRPPHRAKCPLARRACITFIYEVGAFIGLLPRALVLAADVFDAVLECLVSPHHDAINGTYLLKVMESSLNHDRYNSLQSVELICRGCLLIALGAKADNAEGDSESVCADALVNTNGLDADEMQRVELLIRTLLRQRWPRVPVAPHHLSTATHFIAFWADSGAISNDVAELANRAIHVCQREAEFATVQAHLFGASALKWACGQVPMSTEIDALTMSRDLDRVVDLIDMYMSSCRMYIGLTACA